VAAYIGLASDRPRQWQVLTLQEWFQGETAYKFSLQVWSSEC